MRRLVPAVTLSAARFLRLLPVLVCGAAVLAAAPETARRFAMGPLVVVSIDGLRPDYIREADRYGLRIPELRRLAREGASARGRGGRAAHRDLSEPRHPGDGRGARPPRHSRQPPLRSPRPNRDGWYWYAEDLRAPTLWDAAKDAGLATASVDWPVTVGARIDWNLPQVWRADTADDAKLLRAVATPGLLAEAERALGPWPYGSRATPEQDRRKAAFNTWLLRAKHPRLHFAYFASLDEEQHASGPGSPAALRALEALDLHVGELRRAAESYGRPTIAIVSDHGFAPAAFDLDIDGALRREGLVETDGPGRITRLAGAGLAGRGHRGHRAEGPTRRRCAAAGGARCSRACRHERSSAIDRVLTGRGGRRAGRIPGRRVRGGPPARGRAPARREDRARTPIP